MKLFFQMVRGLVGVCILVSLVECVADEETEGLRMICGLSISCSALRVISEVLGQIF